MHGYLGGEVTPNIDDSLIGAALNNYRETSNIRRALGKKLIDHSDVVGALPVGTAPTTSSFST